MSIRRDYVLRLIEEFFKVLARILQLKSDKQYKQALDLIDETSKSLLNIDLNQIATIDENIIILLESQNFNLNQLEILADLLKVKADINLEINNIITAINHYEISLNIFQHVQANSRDYSLSRINKINDLIYSLLNLKA